MEPVTTSGRGAGITFTRHGVLRGFVIGQPLALAAITYGIAFGLLTRQAGLSTLEAAAMSAAIYSGSAQLAALTVMTEADPWTATSAWLLATTILIVNARYILYGATLRPWLGYTRPLHAYSALFVLVDGNWVVATHRYNSGERDAGIILGSGLAMYFAWVAGTTAGSLAGSLIPNPAVLGLDFFLVAFCGATGLALFKGAKDIGTVVVAAVAALAVSRFAAGGWPVIAAGLAGGAFAFVRHAAKAGRP